MDTNQNATTAESWQDVSAESVSLPSTPNDDVAESGEATQDRPTFYGELDLLRKIIKGEHPWRIYLSQPNFADIRGALTIIYSYHPRNDGKDAALPRVTLGDIEQMRKDLMRLSALNCYLAAQAAMYESNADNVEQERKLCRSLSWRSIRRQIRDGAIKEKLTQDDIKHEAESDAASLYRLEYDLRQIGRMYNWVRAAIRTFTDHLGILIQSSMREERGHNRLT